MNKQKKGVLLINLGTPDSPSVNDVRRYLRQFLMDRRVIDIPFINRFLLVQGIIAPFRAFASAKIYKELWTEEGSPLKTYGFKVQKLLQESLGNQYHVAFGMRYQNPSIKTSLDELKQNNVTDITVIPLYPQYASSSTGSSIEQFMEDIKTWEVLPSVKIISQFFDHPLFIETIVERAQEHMSRHNYEHFIFSYHGIPERHIHKSSVNNYCQLSTCCSTHHSQNQYCYRAQCFATTRLLVEKLNIPKEKYTVCFQSRLGRTPWIKPYTDDVIKELAAKGIKSVLAFSPAFVADCLETTIEVGEEYREIFEENGGKTWTLVESLNDNPKWIECLKSLILDQNTQKTAPQDLPENYSSIH